MKIVYRKLASVEARQYREIRLESLRVHPESFGSTFEEQSKLPKLMFEKALEQPVDDRFVMGAFDQTALIGLCGFLPFVPDNYQGFNNTGTIIQMYVKPAYRGRKIGLGLVKAVIRQAFRISDIEQIVLGVKAGNMAAIRVYDQAGFLTYKAEDSEEEGSHVGFRTMIIRHGS
jgi:RimJ/RimL family protein N-acetyltransferase